MVDFLLIFLLVGIVIFDPKGSHPSLVVSLASFQKVVDHKAYFLAYLGVHCMEDFISLVRFDDFVMTKFKILKY